MNTQECCECLGVMEIHPTEGLTDSDKYVVKCGWCNHVNRVPFNVDHCPTDRSVRSIPMEADFDLLTPQNCPMCNTKCNLSPDNMFADIDWNFAGRVYIQTLIVCVRCKEAWVYHEEPMRDLYTNRYLRPECSAIFCRDYDYIQLRLRRSEILLDVYLLLCCFHCG